MIFRQGVCFANSAAAEQAVFEAVLGVQMKSDENAGSVRAFGFRAPRVSANFSFFLDVTATGERYEAMCTDISEDGLAAELPQPIAPKTEVTVRMLLPGGYHASADSGQR